jgi:hypothetical protein
MMASFHAPMKWAKQSKLVRNDFRKNAQGIVSEGFRSFATAPPALTVEGPLRAARCRVKAAIGDLPSKFRPVITGIMALPLRDEGPQSAENTVSVSRRRIPGSAAKGAASIDRERLEFAFGHE